MEKTGEFPSGGGLCSSEDNRGIREIEQFLDSLPKGKALELKEFIVILEKAKDETFKNPIVRLSLPAMKAIEIMFLKAVEMATESCRG
ncbi:MAG: hypothetical protein PHW33_00240 [Candidatus Portnoybacteria bacterium]|jgi:hypothetical protein|nr:hypothetical protein [Candidatus Portnoybacteria bacterium]